MKKVMILTIVIGMSLMFGGCRATPSVASSVAQMYDTTKTIWVKGQEIVVINSDLLDEKTLSQLNKIDEAAKTIDATIKIVDTTVSILTDEELSRYEKLEKEHDELQKYFDNNILGVDDLDLIFKQEEIGKILQMYDMAIINRSRKTLEVINR